MSRKRIWFMGVLILLQSNGYAQNNTFLQNMFSEGRSTYFTMFGGPSKYLGDLGNTNVGLSKLQLPTATFFAGIGIQRYYKKRFSFQIGFSFGSLRGADNEIHYSSTQENDYTRYIRNLDFKTSIKEGSLQFNVYPFQFLSPNSTIYKKRLQPYISLGVGVFSFQPKGSYFDESSQQIVWIDLQSLKTEGEGMAEYPDRKNYSLTQSNLLYGAGFSYFLSDKWIINVEILARKLHTDYLDDVSTTYIDKNVFYKYNSLPEDAELAQLMSDKSTLINPYNVNDNGYQRGNPKNNDAYFTYQVKVAFKIKSKSSKQPNFYKYDDSEICD